MKEIRYFGLDQWAEVLDLLETLYKRKEVSNIAIESDIELMLRVVSWDEELIDLENK